MQKIVTSRRAKEHLLHDVQAEIERELAHRPDSDLAPSGRYESLSRLEQKLMTELGLLKPRALN